jgi:hypothetical protein
MTRRTVVFGLVAFAVSSAVFLVVAFDRPRSAGAAWLAAALGWTNIAAGGLGCGIAASLVSGRWSSAARTMMLRTAGLLPLAAILFLPVLLATDDIYPWAAHPLATKTIAFKAIWLRPEFFIIRAAAYFMIWYALALWLARRRHRKPRAAAAAGAILYAVTASLAAVDWIMSLQPTFHSTIFGLVMIGQQLLAGVAWLLLAAPDESPIYSQGNPGGILLAALLGWAYFHAMQYLVVWSGDIPSETQWYLVRVAPPWDLLAWALFALRLAIPFGLLLSPRIRHSRPWLRGVAAVITATGFAESAWMILPTAPHQGAAAMLWAASLCATGAVWLAGWRAGRGLARDGAADDRRRS